MSRRRVVTALAAAAIIVSIGPSRPAAADDDAATVNGESISTDDFEAAVTDLGSAGVTPLVDDDVVAADAGRQVLTVMILNTLRGQFLTDRGEPLTDDEVAAQADAAAQQNPDLTGVGRDLLTQHFAYNERIAQLEAPTEDDLAAIYDELPARTGVMCLNVISIVGDADEAAAELRDGSAASDVVAGAGSGSRVQDECFSLGELGLTLPGRFRELVELRPGELLDPIETSSGHQILQVAAFDDIASELVGYFADPPVSPGTGQPQAAGDLLLMGYVVTSDVSVDARYGRWDAPTASIVPLGQP